MCMQTYMGSFLRIYEWKSYCSAPTVAIIFHLISYQIIYVANSTLSNCWIHLPVEQTGRPDHLSFT
jgi:hypothetical protein